MPLRHRLQLPSHLGGDHEAAARTVLRGNEVEKHNSISPNKKLTMVFLKKKCRKDDDLLTPIVVTLYDQLDSKQREQQAFSALVRHQVLKNLLNVVPPPKKNKSEFEFSGRVRAPPLQGDERGRLDAGQEPL